MRKWPNVPTDKDGLSSQVHLALDTEYHLRWVEFHMADGTVLDSRHINWRHVMWDRVVKLVVSIRDHRTEVHCMHPGFKCFLNFRKVSLVRRMREDGKGYHDPEEFLVWTIGWTDGQVCHLVDVSIHTGFVVKKYVKKLDDILGHVHPRCRELVDQ